jgi:hypothetical protein
MISGRDRSGLAWRFPVPRAARPSKPELEATKNPKPVCCLGFFFVATMPLIFHHISATSSPKEKNGTPMALFALRYGWGGVPAW